MLTYTAHSFCRLENNLLATGSRWKREPRKIGFADYVKALTQVQRLRVEIFNASRWLFSSCSVEDRLEYAGFVEDRLEYAGFDTTT
ncbi:MAG: hypothetical protein HW387_1416 [Parachlamydiales bacterium]|nr:hypothetical protein [Parachlamydiales bacterium]